MMSYAKILDIEDTDVSRYRKVWDAVGSEPVEGLVVRAAGPTAHGIRIISIWASRADEERFFTERLRRAYDAVPEAGMSARSQDDLDVDDLVLGPAAEPARRS
jgi:hypothetical protein